MKLNLDIIADSLSVNYEMLEKYELYSSLNLEKVILYEFGNDFKSNSVYVARGQDLPESPSFESHCAVISTGTAPKAFSVGQCEYILLPEDVSVLGVVNCVSNAFKKYTLWHDALLDHLVHERGIQVLFNATLPLLDNPVYFHDKEFRVIAYAEPPELSAENDVYKLSIYGGFPSNTVRLLKKIPNFKDTFKTTEPTYWFENDEDPNIYSYLYNNVWYKGVFYGRIFIDERVRSISMSDYVILGKLTRVIELALKRRNIYEKSHFRPLDQELTKLLDGTLTSKNQLDRNLQEMNLNQECSFFCIRIKLSEEDYLLHTIINICDLLESKLPGCVMFPYRDNILGVIFANCWEDRRSKFMNYISPILEEYNMHSGISMMFNNFYDLPEYYMQTSIALKFGEKQEPTLRMHYFEKYSMDYMLDQAVLELHAESLCPSELHILIKHDQKNNTNYVATLRAYLECNSSPARAMEKLFIQRSTFLYRLNRIREIVDIQFEDEDVKFHLLWAFRLLDRYGSDEWKQLGLD